MAATSMLRELSIEPQMALMTQIISSTKPSVLSVPSVVHFVTSEVDAKKKSPVFFYTANLGLNQLNLDFEYLTYVCIASSMVDALKIRPNMSILAH
jgi:hypothetical protein